MGKCESQTKKHKTQQHLVETDERRVQGREGLGDCLRTHEDGCDVKN